MNIAPTECPDPHCAAVPGAEHVVGCNEYARIMRNNAMKEAHQATADKIADVLWFLKGFRAAKSLNAYDDFPIDETHLDALRQGRLALTGDLTP